jgi:hypothetical protein
VQVHFARWLGLGFARFGGGGDWVGETGCTHFGGAQDVGLALFLAALFSAGAALFAG